MEKDVILQGDCLESLKTLPDNSINCCVTSPPYYGLRDYGTGKWVGGDPNCLHMRSTKISKNRKNIATGQVTQHDMGLGVGDAIYKTVCPLCGAVREDKQVGLEETPEQYIERLVGIFREVRRILKDDGVLWVNIGDTYYGSGGGRGTDYHDGRTDVVQSGNKGFNDMKYAPVLTKPRDDLKSKDLIGIPWMLAFALRADGWYLRQDVIWHKPNPMPESVKDRCTKSHEYVFLLSKSPKYYFDYEAIQEPANIQNPSHNIKFGGNKYGDDESPLFGYYSGDDYKPRTKNCQYDGQTPNTMHINREKGLPDKEYVVRQKRDVWSINPAHYKEAHFATFPEELVKPMILSGCPKDGIVLDPFMGSGTVGAVAKKLYRNYVGCELNPEYVKMAENRIGIVTTKVNSRLFDLM